MAFVKLDRGILQSTTWLDKPCRDVFIAALLLAEPREFPEPVEEVKPQNTEMTGWAAPAGWYGFVPSSGPGLIHLAQVKEKEGAAALERLAAADLGSRSKDYEGRRMIRIDGGYLILNYIKHRDRDHTSSLRQQRWRERKRLKANESREVTEETLRNTVTRRNITQVEGDPDPDQEKQIPDTDPERAASQSLLWTAYDWRRKYGLAWCDKYRGHTAMAGDGAADAKLHDKLEELTVEDRLAAQARAPKMFAEFLSELGEVAKQRHRWSWFVGRFDALRVPVLKVVADDYEDMGS